MNSEILSPLFVKKADFEIPIILVTGDEHDRYTREFTVSYEKNTINL